MADKTKPYVPSGYYLWIPRRGTVKRERRYGSSEESTFVDFEGDLYLPGEGGRLHRRPLRRDDKLSFDPRSNLYGMVTIARDGVPPTEQEVDRRSVAWEEVLDVPMVVRVDNDPYHPKIAGSDERDESVTHYATRMRGQPQGWPVGVALPQGVEVKRMDAAAPPAEREPTPDTAPDAPQEERPAPVRQSARNLAAAPQRQDPVPPRPSGPERQHPPAREDLPPSWHEMQRLTARNLAAALERFGWHPPGNEAAQSPEEAAAAVNLFWEYFDGVPPVSRLKHVRADGSAGFYWTPEHGADEDSLGLAAEALSRFVQGQDVRPPMPSGATAGRQE